MAACFAAVELTYWHCALLGLGALCSGLAKTGIAGLGVLTMALFANALPVRASTGALLPLLLCGDLFGDCRVNQRLLIVGPCSFLSHTHLKPKL